MTSPSCGVVSYEAIHGQASHAASPITSHAVSQPQPWNLFDRRVEAAGREAADRVQENAKERIGSHEHHLEMRKRQPKRAEYRIPSGENNCQSPAGKKVPWIETRRSNGSCRIREKTAQ